MRSVLVPLDGTDFSATILDDAVRLAGQGGTLILMEVVSRPYGRGAAVYNVQVDTEEAREYLAGVAEGLRSRRISVTTVAKSTFHPSAAIDEVARANQVNMIACATHSRGAIGTVLWGSVAWKILSQSPVPVLLRHPVADGKSAAANPEQRRVLVPLDGSPLAQEALPLAQELAAEWQAPIDLVRVVPDLPAGTSTEPAQEYLTSIRYTMTGKVQEHVLNGNPVEELVAFVYGARVTDVVMASHGRTGLARVFLGSVAHEIVRRLSLPVVVVPALSTGESEQPEDTVQSESQSPAGRM